MVLRTSSKSLSANILNVLIFDIFAYPEERKTIFNIGNSIPEHFTLTYFYYAN